jgi:hypothetical protein
VNAPLGRSPFLVSLTHKRYEALPANLKKIVDDTTGLKLSLKGAAVYDKQSKAAEEAVKKDSNRELIPLSAAENKRWREAFKPLIRQKIEEGEKAGLPAKGLVDAYGLLS